MKHKAMLLILLLSIAGSALLAQEDTIPPIPPKHTKAARIGALGGFTPGWLFIDVDPINKFLVPAKGAALSNDGVFLYGGGGAAYIMFIPNLRVGGLGMGGSIRSTSLDGAGVRRDADLNVSFGGVTLEYVVPLMERMDLAVGTMLGGGGLTLRLREDVGGNKTWAQEWQNFGSGIYQDGSQINNVLRRLDGSFFVWIPSVNVEYALLGWLAARVGVSYVGMSAPSWKIDEKDELLGVPTDVSGKGFMLNAGIFVGTF